MRVSLAHEMNVNMYVYIYTICIHTFECACLLFIFWHNCDFALFHIEFVPQKLRPYYSFSIMAGQGMPREGRNSSLCPFLGEKLAQTIPH